MSIESAIKQKSFRTPHHRLVVNLLYTAGWLELRNQKLFRPFGITPQQFNILRILRGSHPEPCSVRVLTERMLDKSSNASRLVDKLVEKQLVERRICPADRRRVEVTITPQGLDMLAQIDDIMYAPDQDLRGLSPKEADQLSQMLDRLRLANGAQD